MKTPDTGYLSSKESFILAYGSGGSSQRSGGSTGLILW
jgi:hypothetical protein